MYRKDCDLRPMKSMQPRASASSVRVHEFVLFVSGAIIVFFVLVVAIVLLLNPGKGRWS